MLRITAVVACVLLALPLLPSASSVRAAGTVELPTGSVWVYDYSEQVNATIPYYNNLGSASVYLMIGGSWSIECIGLADSVEGSNSPTLEFHSSILANVSGQVVISYWYPWPTSQSFSAEGTLRIASDEFYNLTTGFLVRSEYDQEFKVGCHIGGEYKSIVYYCEHNETTYTAQELNYYGKNIDPGYGNRVSGDNWTMVYQGLCNATGVIQTSPFSFVGGVSEVLHYTYIGEQSVTVPAGDFVCKVVKSSSDDYNTTEWYDPAVENNVKIVTSAEDDTATSSLRSYTLNHELLSVDEGSSFNLAFFVLGAVVAISAVILTPLVYIWATRRSLQK